VYCAFGVLSGFFWGTFGVLWEIFWDFGGSFGDYLGVLWVRMISKPHMYFQKGPGPIVAKQMMVLTIFLRSCLHWIFLH